MVVGWIGAEAVAQPHGQAQAQALCPSAVALSDREARSATRQQAPDKQQCTTARNQTPPAPGVPPPPTRLNVLLHLVPRPRQPVPQLPPAKPSRLVAQKDGLAVAHHCGVGSGRAGEGAGLGIGGSSGVPS